jgi:hypothetical protein
MSPNFTRTASNAHRAEQQRRAAQSRRVRTILKSRTR